ncbi:MAG: hypothetical protein PHE50_03205 [Dehalococcoidales bacterium]|nr:hypothetical protein [Dehalococcoidales bacterium]
MGTIYRRAYRLRRATPKWGIEITLPSELIHQEVLKPGDVVDLIYSFDGFVLIVPQGVRVDEEFLKRAVLQSITT